MRIYEIQRSLDAIDWTTVQFINAPTLIYEHENQGQSGVTTHFRVRSINDVVKIPQTEYTNIRFSLYSSANSTSCSQTIAPTENYFEVQKMVTGGSWVVVKRTLPNETVYEHENLGQSDIEQTFRVAGVHTGLASFPQTVSLPLYSSFVTSAPITCSQVIYRNEDFFEVHKSLDNINFSVDVKTLPNIDETESINNVFGYTYYFKVRAGIELPPQGNLPLYSDFSATEQIIYDPEAFTLYTATQLKLTELYVVELTNGVILRFTSHDVNITHEATVYTAIPIVRSAVEYKTNFQIDKLDISLGTTGITIGDQLYTVPQAIERGWFGKAKINIYIVEWPVPQAFNLLFEGYITGNLSYSQGTLQIECLSVLSLLQRGFPRLIYDPLCQHNLYSIGTFACNVSKISKKVTGSVDDSVTEFRLVNSLFAYSAYGENYWLGGELKFVTGLNSGVTRSIRLHGDGFVEFRSKFPETAVTGNSFEVYPGCSKTSVSCISKFNNLINYFGFEHIPTPETIYATDSTKRQGY